MQKYYTITYHHRRHHNNNNNHWCLTLKIYISLECGIGFIKCNDGSCVTGRNCDGYPDCYDFSDELNCTNCGQFEFRCKNGQCINDKQHCDNIYDCEDGSDEENCGMSF